MSKIFQEPNSPKRNTSSYSRSSCSKAKTLTVLPPLCPTCYCGHLTPKTKPNRNKTHYWGLLLIFLCFQSHIQLTTFFLSTFAWTDQNWIVWKKQFVFKECDWCVTFIYTPEHHLYSFFIKLKNYIPNILFCWTAWTDWPQNDEHVMNYRSVCIVELIQKSKTHVTITDPMSGCIDCVNLLPSPHFATLVAMETLAIYAKYSDNSSWNA